MTRTADITSFTEFRARLRDHLDKSKSSGRPLFVTSNGETEAVVLSPTAYDSLAEDAEFARSLRMLDRSMEDIKHGRTRPAKQAIDEIAAELGLTLKHRRAKR